jgi:phenylpropionate dioxygenase-like ring-hydroxylating dioxygenase large terminal subunit
MVEMEISTHHWYPVLSSRELGKRPAGRIRFGERLVFWRTADGTISCMSDVCPHRGAALSLGRVKQNSLACPFHGLEFATDGSCTHIPVETDQSLCAHLKVATQPVREAAGFIWIWRGSAPATDALPPFHPDLADKNYGESLSVWPAHYTRCIENVCDYSHLPFVHRTTIGLFKREYTTQVEIEDVPGGFRAHLLQQGKRKQYLEFLYPNLWMLRVSGGNIMSAVFVPIDNSTTQVYGRTWHGLPMPGLRRLMDAYTRFSQFMVFREDWPIVASQLPGDVSKVTDEKLLPSDAPVVAYRKLHRAATASAGPEHCS